MLPGKIRLAGIQLRFSDLSKSNGIVVWFQLQLHWEACRFQERGGSHGHSHRDRNRFQFPTAVLSLSQFHIFEQPASYFLPNRSRWNGRLLSMPLTDFWDSVIRGEMGHHQSLDQWTKEGLSPFVFTVTLEAAVPHSRQGCMSMGGLLKLTKGEHTWHCSAWTTFAWEIIFIISAYAVTLTLFSDCAIIY